MAQVIEVSTIRFENGMYALTFDGAIKGDCAKFDSKREAEIAALSWNGKEDGRWEGSTWVEVAYRAAI